MLQEPLEEGGVRVGGPPEDLLPGLTVGVRLSLLAVAQQDVEQISHPQPSLSEPLDHGEELEGFRESVGFYLWRAVHSVHLNTTGNSIQDPPSPSHTHTHPP